eukprot:138959-Pyramimonas_sp.AAC.1
MPGVGKTILFNNAILGKAHPRTAISGRCPVIHLVRVPNNNLIHKAGMEEPGNDVQPPDMS